MESTIEIKVSLDDQKMPEKIKWNAPAGGVDEFQEARALLLGIWDEKERSALRIDLWINQFAVDEMIDFFFQTFHGMADTYARSTRDQEMADELKAFAKAFHKKAMDRLRESSQP